MAAYALDLSENEVVKDIEKTFDNKTEILKKIFAILLIFTFQSSAFGANTAENSLDIKLIDNQFHTSEGKVPAVCCGYL